MDLVPPALFQYLFPVRSSSTCLETVGQRQVKLTCIRKKAMTVDILISKDIDPVCVQIPFETEFAVISPGRAWCCFDKSLSRGENREEFKIRIEPQFMFASIKRQAVEDFFSGGHFRTSAFLCMIMPAEYFTTGHDAACSPPETGIETHCACSVNVVPMRSDGEYSVRTWLRNGFFAVLVLANWTVVYKVVASRPHEDDYESLQLQMAENTIYTFARVKEFKDAILGGRNEWKNLPLLLDMMRSRLEPHWVSTMSKVLAAIINRKPESVKSPFESLIMYLELAMKRRSPDSLDYRVLTPLVSVYADFLEAGWSPTYEEMEVRPKYGATRLRDPQNAGAKNSDLCLFALLLVNSSDPLMRAACIRAIRVLGGRTARKQPILHITRFVNICMLPPDPKTQKPYQGLPPQGLSIALPRKSFHLAPFAYSMWLYLQDEAVRSESGTRIFHIVSHATPASTVPQIQLFLAPGPGKDYNNCRFEVRLGDSHFVPDEGTGVLKRHAWVHVCLVLGRRNIILYINAEVVMQKETSGMQQFSNLRGPQRGTCYVGIPPPDLVPYHAMNWFFPGYIFELAYHDEGLSASQVEVLHAGGRRSLPLNLSSFESAEDTESCCIYPYIKWKPTPLHWLVTSDIWEKLEGPILTLLASKDHLMNETEVDEFQLEAVRALRSAASHLLAACFDLDEVCSRRLRQWAVNFAQVKLQVPPVIKLHLNDESFSFEFKLRFRQYSNLEEGAKVQTIMANVNEKRAMASTQADARDQFRICIESLPSTTNDPEKEGMYTGSDSKNCWFLTFVYFQNVTQLKLPPQTGPDGWLHCTIGYVDGKTELAAAWDGEEPRITIESYTKDMFRTEAYLGCEVQVTGSVQKICNQLLCDLAYVRVWDNYEPADKLNKEFADAGAPNAMLVAGNQAVFVCLMPIIHEDRGYILDAVPMSADVGTTVTTTAAAQKSGPNTKVFPSVRSRYNVSMQWPGCLFCSLDYVPIFTAPRAISDGLVLQDGLLPHSCAVLRANSSAGMALPVGTGSWPCTQPCLSERGAYQFQWLIHHPSSINGSIKKEQCAVGLLLQNDFSELYRASCATLDVTLDTKMAQQTPDKRLNDLDEAKEAIKISLTRRGCILRMQLLFADSALWISVFVNDRLIDAQSLVLPPQSVLVPFVHMGLAGQMFQSLPNLFSSLTCDHFKFQLPGKKERLSLLPISHVTWPSYEHGVAPPAVSTSNSIYAAYCNFRDFEADVLPNPSNDVVLERINIPLLDPRAEKTRALLEAILEGALRDKDRGEVRFPEDMLLLAAMCSSEQIWRFVARKRKDSELYLAMESLLSSQATFMGLAEATKRKRYALLALGILLRFPHSYEALFEMGFLQVMARFLSTGLPSVHDEASDTSGLTARLSTRALRVDSWKNRLQAARNMYSLLGTTSHLLPPVEAPTYVDTFSEMRSVVGSSTQERSEVSYVLQECQDATAADLGKFTDALRTYSAGTAGLRSPGSPDNASVILSVLNTLTHMIGRDEYPTRAAESEHQAQRLKMHASSNIYECCIPDASNIVITFDNIPIGNGSVEILEGGTRRGIWSRFSDDAEVFKPEPKVTIQSAARHRSVDELAKDTFQWRFKYESEEILNSVQDHEDSVDRENRGYRFVVRPVWDTDDAQTIFARRQLILDKPGFVKLLTSLHSQAKGLGAGGEKVQNEVDLKVVMLLSFLAQRGTKPPHPAMTAEDPAVEKIIFQIMFQLLESRPNIERQCGVGGKRRELLDRQHISVARFYHGISSSEEGRQHFAYHQEAIMKIVDIANNNTQGASKPDCQPASHQALCYDGNYIIRCLTNFSNKPSKWALTTSLNLLRPKQHAAGWMCEFARGEVVWSLSLHVFLMDEHQADMPAIVFYKGTSPSEVQLAVGVGHATTVSTETKVIPGCHPIIVRYTHDGRLKTLTIPSKFVEIYRWAHLVRPLTCNRRHRFCPALLGLGGIGEGKLWEALHSFMPLVHGKVNMAVVMNGELIYTHTLPCELMAVNFQPGHQDTFLGAPPWEYGRSTTASAWVYQLMLVGGRAMEPQHAKEVQAQDELKAWQDNGTDMQHFDYSRIGLTGSDDLPDPVHLPGLPVQIFDARLKVASEEGIEVLCDLLKDPLEAQKQAAGQALRNLADPAVVTNMRKVVSVLLRSIDPDTGADAKKMDNVCSVMLEAREAATFEAVAELATNLLTWTPPPGEEGIDREARLELIKHIVKQHSDSAITEARQFVMFRRGHLVAGP
ncbi:RYR1 [Symbiodinium sp. KB8]|nr:RYR1 [Symbiodinium sp. KB8]